MNWMPIDLVPIVAILSVFSFLIISSIAYYGYKSFCFGRLTRLKERLLEAGMTSTEIERIVNAGTNTGANDVAEPIQKKKLA